MYILSLRHIAVLYYLCRKYSVWELFSKIICLKTFHNSVLGGSTAYVTATSEIRTLVIVIGGKKIIIQNATLAFVVVIFLRRFMTIRHFVFKSIMGVLVPDTTRSLGMFFYKLQ
jgi:hypothetical protein